MSVSVEPNLTPQDHGRYTQEVAPLTVGPHFPGVITISPQYNINGIHTAVNVINWEGSSTGYTISMLQSAQSAFDSAWSTIWKVLAASPDQYLGSIVTDMSSATGLQVRNTGYAPVTAIGTGNPTPDNVAMLISLKTATHYKGGHGRVYVPSCATGNLQADGNTLTTPTQTNLNSLWSSTVTALAGVSSANGGPYNPVLWHKKLRTAPNTVEVIITGIASARVATQRRRLRKVPHH